VSTGFLPSNSTKKKEYELIDIDDVDIEAFSLNDLLDDDVVVETIPNTSITWYYRTNEGIRVEPSIDDMAGIKQVSIISGGSNNYGVVISPVKLNTEIDFQFMNRNILMRMSAFGVSCALVVHGLITIKPFSPLFAIGSLSFLLAFILPSLEG
jgi:hypothetical protein